MPKLCWRHHTLIQALLSRGPLSEKDFHSLFSKVTGKSPGSLFNEYLRMINEELAYVQFELRACRNQYDGKVFYGVVNNVSDDQSRLGTKYSLPQIAFYKGIAIIDEVKNYELQDCMDSPRWTLEANGTFSVKSAWDYVRHRKVQKVCFHNIWLKGLPFKFSFIAWRIWNRMLPTDDVIEGWGFLLPSKCSCCDAPQIEALQHIFLTGHIAHQVWSYYMNGIGIRGWSNQIREMLNLWWNAQGTPQLQLVYKAVPAMVFWFLWTEEIKEETGKTLLFGACCT